MESYNEMITKNPIIIDNVLSPIISSISYLQPRAQVKWKLVWAVMIILLLSLLHSYLSILHSSIKCISIGRPKYKEVVPTSIETEQYLGSAIVK